MSRTAASGGSGRKQGQPFGMGYHTATETVLTFASGQELCLRLPTTWRREMYCSFKSGLMCPSKQVIVFHDLEICDISW